MKYFFSRFFYLTISDNSESKLTYVRVQGTGICKDREIATSLLGIKLLYLTKIVFFFIIFFFFGGGVKISHVFFLPGNSVKESAKPRCCCCCCWCCFPLCGCWISSCVYTCSWCWCESSHSAHKNPNKNVLFFFCFSIFCKLLKVLPFSTLETVLKNSINYTHFANWCFFFSSFTKILKPYFLNSISLVFYWTKIVDRKLPNHGPNGFLSIKNILKAYR